MRGATCIDLASDGTDDAFASGIAVSGGTVYTVGGTTDGTKNIACYWTGTARTDLPDNGSTDAYINAVF